MLSLCQRKSSFICQRKSSFIYWKNSPSTTRNQIVYWRLRLIKIKSREHSSIPTLPRTATALVQICADHDVGIGGPDHPLKNHENIAFLSNTGPDPLKNHKATKPAFNVGLSSAHQRNAIKWRVLADR